MKQFAVAIDGPSGAGKSTVAKTVARKLGILYVDTGAMYRAIGLAVCRCGISENDVDGIAGALAEIHISLRYDEKCGQRIFLDAEDVSELIRTQKVAQYASKCSAVPAVRAFLLDLQRNLVIQNSVIMDGRDIGTVILPHADVKIFLTASVETRAWRRFLELQEKGQEAELPKIEQEIRQRDEQDMNRPIAPLCQAPDAILLDTSALDFDGSVQAVLDIIKSKV